MSGLPGMPEALRHDWQNLTELVNAAASRDVVPCRNGEQVPHSFWTSDNAAEQTEAAAACGPCPARDACLAYGIQHPAESGVYALTERQRAKAAREIAKRETGK